MKSQKKLKEILKKKKSLLRENDLNRYMASLSEELASQCDRVRQLIGRAHWGHDGSHKEVLLRGMMEKYLPAQLSVHIGFVISQDGRFVSTEQDILVIDPAKEPPLFKQGIFIVCFACSVIAAISVKSTFGKNEIEDTVRGTNTVREIFRSTGLDQSKLWTAGFFFNSSKTRIYKNFGQIAGSISKREYVEKSAVAKASNHRGGPDLLVSLDGHIVFFQYRHFDGKMDIKPCFESGLAAAVFISNLLEHVHHCLGIPRSIFSDLTVNFSSESSEIVEFSIL